MVIGWAPCSPLSAAETCVVIEHCSVFDPESGTMLPDRTIVVRGTQIVSVRPADALGEVPAEAQVIDGRGKFALPGLILSCSGSAPASGTVRSARA